ncbi:MAG: META domain-containing protein [Solirubrobacterales bacterium]|nr:META domain-containing protein [Solirubrobacterales bacterium]
MPVSVSLEGQPYSADWPDSPDFTARLKVVAGEEGAEFGFRVDPTYWGVDGVSGLVFRDGQAALDGPGQLTSERAGAGGPSAMPGYCARGESLPGFHNELKLPPNASTVVEMPVSLTASPLAGMDSTLRISYYATSHSSLSPVIESPVQVGGKSGVVVRFDTGSVPGYLEASNRKPVILAGSTSPALPNTEILIKATPFIAGNPPPPDRWIRVTTDSEGNFSQKVSFGRSAFWRLVAFPQDDSTYDDEPSCGPTLKSTVDTYLATYSDLNNRTFRSESVQGTKKLIGQKKITLSFSGGKWVDHDGNSSTPNRLIYYLTGNAGCNTIFGQYWLKDGRLVWSRYLGSTEMACPKPVDKWLIRTLRRGVKARLVKGKLVLTGGRGIRITLAAK